MKNFITPFLLLIVFQVTATSKVKPFTLYGKVTDTDSGFVLIRNLIKPVADTVRIKKGEFQFSGEIEEVTPFVIADITNKYQIFFIAPKSEVHMTLKKNEMVLVDVAGSEPQDIYKKLVMSQMPAQKVMDQLRQAIQQPTANRDSLQQLMSQTGNQMNANFYQFLKDHGNSEVASFLVYSSISQDRGIDATIADSMYSFLNGKGVSSFYGTEAKKTIDKLRAVTIGYMAPDFTLPDSSTKKKYSLSSFRGKYVLVDFWASWCGPCKGEIPYMKTAYERFHAKGFEILSVSLDEKREAWLNALKQFNMPWYQVSDSKGFRSVVNDLYPIPSIPKTLLLDKEGKIIATDLRGDALDRKLEELLGK